MGKIGYGGPAVHVSHESVAHVGGLFFSNESGGFPLGGPIAACRPLILIFADPAGLFTII
jgi:hypothetical protein